MTLFSWSLLPTASQEQDEQAEAQELVVAPNTPPPTASPQEEVGLFSRKHQLQPARHSFEAAVPT